MTDANGRTPQATVAAASDYVLRLYVAGHTARSMRAVENVRSLCDSHRQGRYELEIVDLYQQPEAAAREQLVAAPTLIKRAPPPVRRMVGDMSDSARVLSGLDLHGAT